MGKSARQIEHDRIVSQKKKLLALKNPCNQFYIGAGVRTDLDRLESRALTCSSFRHFANVWRELDFGSILNGHPQVNEDHNYCHRDFVEEFYFILTERLVADVRSKRELRACLRLFTLYGVYSKIKIKIRIGIKQLESLNNYWAHFRPDRLNREAYVIYKKLLLSQAFCIVAVKRTCLLGNMFTSSPFSTQHDYCQAALYEKRDDQPEKAEIFDTSKISDLSLEYEHIYRAMLERKEIRGQLNWSHRNVGETIYETGQLIEQLDSRPLQLKNQMKATELRANFIRRRTNSETAKVKKKTQDLEVALVVKPKPTRRKSIVTKADFDAEKRHPMAISVDEMKVHVMAEIDKIYTEGTSQAKQLIDEREHNEELKRKRQEDRQREINMERAQKRSQEAEKERQEVVKRRKMNVKNEKRRLERQIARLDRGQWQIKASSSSNSSPTKPAPVKIQFQPLSDPDKQLEPASIVVLGELIILTEFQTSNFVQDGDATDNWPVCPLHLALITWRDSEDEMVATKLLKLSSNNKLLASDDHELTVAYDDIKFTVAHLSLNTKLTSVQLETLRCHHACVNS